MTYHACHPMAMMHSIRSSITFHKCQAGTHAKILKLFSYCDTLRQYCQLFNVCHRCGNYAFPVILTHNIMDFPSMGKVL